MLSDLLPSSESDSEGDVGSSQRDVGEGDEVGEGKDGPYVVKTQENRELGARLSVLREERLRLAQKTEARRISALQKQAVKAVHRALNAGDQEVLKDKGIVLPEVARRRQRKRRHHESTAEDDAASHHKGHTRDMGSTPVTSDSAAAEGLSADMRQQWVELRKYLDPNPQLRGTEQGRHMPKSGVEKALDKAVEEGDFERAVDLSSQLAGREFAVKIAGAFDCLEYLKQKEVQESKGKGKRKKLHWSFDAKQRWETKSNM